MIFAKSFRFGAVAVAFAGLLGLAPAQAGSHGGSAGAETSARTTWVEDHPRRDEVNDRLENQDQRIDAEEKTGAISASQAAGLHAQDQAIHAEEKTMASHDGSHLTTADQKALNQQLNAVSKEIGK